jgi:hypothetical protein
MMPYFYGGSPADQIRSQMEDDGSGSTGRSSSPDVFTRDNYADERYSSYNQVVNWSQDTWGFSTRTEIKGRINDAAQRWFNSKGFWPSATELFADDLFQRSMGVLASGTPYLLPPFFNMDGILYVNDPITGPERVGPHHPAFADSAEAARLGGVLGSVDPGGPHDIARRGSRSGESLPGFQDLFANVPFTTREQVMELLVGARPRGGGGGGGGGGGRPDLVFDEAQLAEQARNIWRGLMLEEPGDVSSLVSGYVKEANSFWRGQGGRLDFQTYITNQARDTGRYKNLYRKKPEFQSEAEYLGGFRQTAAGFGLSASETLRQVEAGATSGASLTGFSTRLERGRENQLNQQGTFSQRFANSINQLGAIGRA